MTGTATLSVTVQDINDNGPQLVDAEDLWLPRRVAPRSVVARVKIRDRDSPENDPTFTVNVCSNSNTPGCRDLIIDVTGGESDSLILTPQFPQITFLVGRAPLDRYLHEEHCSQFEKAAPCGGEARLFFATTRRDKQREIWRHFCLWNSASPVPMI